MKLILDLVEPIYLFLDSGRCVFFPWPARPSLYSHYCRVLYQLVLRNRSNMAEYSMNIATRCLLLSKSNGSIDIFKNVRIVHT